MINEFTRSYPAAGDGVNVVEASVFYMKGGVSWATGEVEPRGWWFSIQPIMLEDHGTYTCRSFAAFSGVKTFVAPATRQTKAGYAKVRDQIGALCDEHLAAFCERNGIELTGAWAESERERRVV